MSMRRTGPSKVSQRSQLADAVNRNSLLIDKIRKLESQLATQTAMNDGMSERARVARQQITNLVRTAATNTQSFSPASIHEFDAEVHRTLETLLGRMWFDRSTTTDFEREIRAMFSQQHYGKMAELIKAQRIRIENDHAMPPVDKDAQHKAINEFQASLIKTFEDDNPKFKTFKFIEACSHHVIG
jgi:hypothetical protein